MLHNKGKAQTKVVQAGHVIFLESGDEVTVDRSGGHCTPEAAAAATEAAAAVEAAAAAAAALPAAAAASVPPAPEADAEADPTADRCLVPASVMPFPASSSVTQVTSMNSKESA